jgi:hypothetical protein
MVNVGQHPSFKDQKSKARKSLTCRQFTLENRMGAVGSVKQGGKKARPRFVKLVAIYPLPPIYEW